MLVDIFEVEADQVNLKVEKAMVVLWALLTTNPFLLKRSTVLVKTREDLERITRLSDEGQKIYYIDMRSVYQALKPLEPEEIDSHFRMALNDHSFRTVASHFEDVQEQRASGPYPPGTQCLAAKNVVGLNKG